MVSKMTMAGLGSMVLGVVLIIVLYGIIPMIGYQIDTAVTLGAASEWNHSVNADIPTGPSFWTTISGFVTLAALMLFVGGFIGTLRGLKG
jgi:hypothetical protein